MSPGRADLLFDEIKIIEQPFGGRRDAMLPLDRLQRQAPRPDQDLFIFGEARKQFFRVSRGTQDMRLRERSAIVLQLLRAEQG